MKWAILSGIEGNLAAYEAVLKDLRRLAQPVTELYVLGDVIGLNGSNLQDNNLQDDSLQDNNLQDDSLQDSIHGSTAGYADELTPETPAIELCDRLIRAGANHLFCGRSGRTFECWVSPTQLHSTVTTLDGPQPVQDQSKTPRRIMGVGSVGRTPGQATYTLYSPGSNQLSFRTANYKQANRVKAKGFGPSKGRLKSNVIH